MDGAIRSQLSQGIFEEQLEKVSAQAEPLLEAYQQLEEGEFFHNIPQQVQVNQPFIIEAGIGEEVTQAMLDTLDIEGPVTVSQGVVYNPLQADLVLLAAPEDKFSVEAIVEGRRPAIANEPVSWKWLVTPLAPGEYSLQIESLVFLEGSQSQQSNSQIIADKMLSISATPQYWFASYVRRTKFILFPLISVFMFGITAFCVTRTYYRQKAISALSPANQLEESKVSQ